MASTIFAEDAPTPSFLEEARIARDRMWGLIFQCPFGGNPRDCLAREIRELTIKERFLWLNHLTDQECVNFYRQHLRCLASKEMGGPGLRPAIE